MVIGKVVGTVVASRKHERLVGGKIQIVQPLEPRSLKPDGEPFVAVDAVGAGVGEQVLIVCGSAARKAIDNESSPVDATIVGIIDEVDIPTRRGQARHETETGTWAQKSIRAKAISARPPCSVARKLPKTTSVWKPTAHWTSCRRSLAWPVSRRRTVS